MRLADGLAAPAPGDDIIASGALKVTPYGLELAAESWTKVRTAGLGGALTSARQLDLRARRLDFRRVSFRGRVVDATHEGNLSVLRLKEGHRTVLVHVPGPLDEAAYRDKIVELIGCVFPIVDAQSGYLGSYIEVEDADAIDIVASPEVTVNLPRWAALALSVLAGLVLLALLALLVYAVHAHRVRAKMAIIAAERKRMAQELHDTIEQYLASVRLVLAGTLQTAADLSPETRRSLSYASEALAQAKREVRDAVMNLRSDEALDAPPADALREMAASLNQGGKVRVRYAFQKFLEKLPPGAYQDFLAIVREAVTNAIKHGHAHEIVLAGDGPMLRVLNDGEPFESTDALGPETGHFGLVGMRERAARSGFTITWERDGKWTLVRLVRAIFTEESVSVRPIAPPRDSNGRVLRQRGR